MIRARTIATVGVFAGLMSTAEAHFKLNAPENRSNQDALGGPQKSAPCGTSDSSTTADNSTPTGLPPAELKTGSLVTISINETIFHPGHYRVSLAQDAASLPADPLVTAGSTPCGSTVIDANPTLPLLADGLLVHTTSFGGVTKTMSVQLPAGMQCTNCVLQVVQFMSNHPLNNPGGCFYHHCAIVNISDTAPNQPDAGVMPGDDAGTTPAGAAGGCCNANTTESSTGGVLGAAMLGLLVLRRRRR